MSKSKADEALEKAQAANADLEPVDPSPEWVEMSHPAVEGPNATATREAFDEVWEPRGWVLEEEGVSVPPVAERNKAPEKQDA